MTLDFCSNARKFYEKLGFERIWGADENHMGLKFANWKNSNMP